MTKYSYYLLLSCLMLLAGCQTVEPLAGRSQLSVRPQARSCGK